MIYVSSLGSISVIDGSMNKVIAGVTFNINPPNAGHIICGKEKEELPTNQFRKIKFGRQCIAKSNKGFEFSSWVKNVGKGSSQTISSMPKSRIWYTFITDWLKSIADTVGIKIDHYDSTTFTITRYGNFTANFDKVPPPLPPEYWATIFGVVVSSVVDSLFIPGIIAWRKSKSHIRRLHGFHKKNESLSHDRKLDEDDLKSLDKLNRGIEHAYAIGNLSDQQHQNLKSEVSLLYYELLRRRIDQLNGVPIRHDGKNDRLLDRIK
jgi:hypothetical protein